MSFSASRSIGHVRPKGRVFIDVVCRNFRMVNDRHGIGGGALCDNQAWKRKSPQFHEGRNGLRPGIAGSIGAVLNIVSPQIGH